MISAWGNRSWIGRLALALDDRCAAGAGCRAGLFLTEGLFVGVVGVLVVSHRAFADALPGDGAMRFGENRVVAILGLLDDRELTRGDLHRAAVRHQRALGRTRYGPPNGWPVPEEAWDNWLLGLK